ncbi:hypothetical protein ACMD2_21047 [Ananas comosus]|uniref:Uncharacterized protein n=1 Tax=Ananas comosus TaxID=4615 RepID=A0A199VS68_ANACO|nr:hypothetical protein ACMD2_21047 [Ananas comosus]
MSHRPCGDSFEQDFQDCAFANGVWNLTREPSAKVLRLVERLTSDLGIVPSSRLYPRFNSWRLVQLVSAVTKLQSLGFLASSRLPSSPSHERLCKAPRLEGIMPWKALNDRSRLRYSRDESRPSEIGIVPERLLEVQSSKSWLKEERFVRVDGMVPVRLFSWISSMFKERRLPKDGGMAPDKLEQLPSEDGIVPRREFTLRLRYRSRRRIPNSSGMCPPSLLSDRSIVRRNVRLATAGDTKPARPRDVRLRAMTRSGWRRPQETPRHLQ